MGIATGIGVGVVFGGGGVIPDPDAQNFIDIVGITDVTQKSALDTLVKDLKAINDIQADFVNFDTPANSVLKAVYPFLGDTAATHKYNLIDPQDADASFRLVFAADHEANHTSNGYKPNGTDQYADTKLVPNTSLTLDDTHFGIYCTDDGGVSSGVDMACGAGTNQVALAARYTGDIFLSREYSSANSLDVGNVDAVGFFLSIKTSAAYRVKFKNGRKLRVQTGVSGAAMPAYSVTIGAMKAATVTLFNSRNYGFATMGGGMSDDAAVLYDAAVYKFMLALGRVTERVTTRIRAGICLGVDDSINSEYLVNYLHWKTAFRANVVNWTTGTLTGAQIMRGLQIVANGWEIGTHADITAYRATHTPAETWTAIIKPVHDEIIANLGVTPVCFADHATVAYDLDMSNYLFTKGYSLHRIFTEITAYYTGTNQIIGSTLVENTITYEAMKTIIDDCIANDKICMFHCHSVTANIGVVWERSLAYLDSVHGTSYKPSELIPALFGL